MKTLLLIVILLILTTSTLSLFCSSACVTSYSGCAGSGNSGVNCSICIAQDRFSCYICANKIYNLVANTSSATPCTPLPQIQILAEQLLTQNMSLTGYSSSSLIPQQCSNYTLSGHYITHDYIAKNFTNIPPNHYAIIIRFSIVSIGNWTNQSITLITNDTYTLNSYSFPYICTDPDDICDQGTMDCIKAHDVILPHNTTSLIVNFTTNYTFIDNQFWGINNLIIAAKLCHPYCLLCFGGNQSQCFSCAENNYLQGNYCQKQCDKGSFKFDATRQCLKQCPNTYYADKNSSTCLKCSVGCLLCTSIDQCQAYQVSVPNLWQDNLAFWILLIIVLIIVIILFVYCLARSKIQPVTGVNEKMISKDEKHDELYHDGKIISSVVVTKDEHLQTGQSVQIVENTLHELWFDHIEEVDDSDPRAPSRTVTLATAAGRQRKRRFRAADAAEITANQL